VKAAISWSDRIINSQQEIPQIVTNLMYTPRALFSRRFLKIFFVLSLYTYGRSASDPPLWNKFRISIIIH